MPEEKYSGFWIRANYIENLGREDLAVEAPETLREGTLGDLIGYMLSDEAREVQQICRPSELDILGKISSCVEMHKKALEGEYGSMLQIELQDKGGVWIAHGSRGCSVNMEEQISPYIKTEVKELDGENIEVDVLNILFLQTFGVH